MSDSLSPALSHYTAEEKRHRIFAIIAVSSGNLVEWFDFYVYAFTTLYFSSQFSLNPIKPHNYSTLPQSLVQAS